MNLGAKRDQKVVAGRMQEMEMEKWTTEQVKLFKIVNCIRWNVETKPMHYRLHLHLKKFIPCFAQWSQWKGALGAFNWFIDTSFRHKNAGEITQFNKPFQ